MCSPKVADRRDNMAKTNIKDTNHMNKVESDPPHKRTLNYQSTVTKRLFPITK